MTYAVAKPAIPFGGKYRIIDFPLSNCTNSDINTVGVLTQYQPHLLHQYIGLGTPWDLDRRNGGVTMLPPYAEADGIKWYDGTANAIFQNLKFLEAHDPEYVLILSGDHIYKMDYSRMLRDHVRFVAENPAWVRMMHEEGKRRGPRMRNAHRAAGCDHQGARSTTLRAITRWRCWTLLKRQ